MLLFVLAVGAYFDLRYRRIPNWWILSSAAVGILISMLCSKETGAAILGEAGQFIFRMAVPVALFFILFLCRMIGAGDLKTMALICGYLGIGKGFAAIWCGLLVGAILSFVILVFRQNLAERLSYFIAYIRRIYRTKKITAYYEAGRDGPGVVIPLAACLFLGTLVYIIITIRR